MNRIFVSLSVVGILSVIQACGSAGFGGTTPKKTGVQQAGQTTPVGAEDPNFPGNPSKPGLDQTKPNGPGGPITANPNLPSDDQKAIAKCLKVWGNHPFSAPFANVKKINAAVNVLGFGKSIKDLDVTPGPVLTIISAAVSVGGQTTMELRNPNGWYCLKVDVNVLSNTTINLDCRAKMADTRVDVGVLSNSDATGIVGVHVLSDVKVNRVGC